MDRPLFLRQFDPLHLFQFLDPALYLLGLGGLVPKAVDKHFELLDTLALIPISRIQLVAALRLLGDVFVIIARIEVNPLVPNFHDLFDRHIQKIAVVRDEYEGIGIIFQVVLQPVARLQVEMIGWLVQQQQVRLLQQKLRQGNPHLPSTREFLSATRPIFFLESEPSQHRPDLGLDGISIPRLKLVFYAMKMVCHLGVFRGGMVEFCHAPGQFFHLLFHGAQIGKHGHTFVKNCLPRKRQPILGKIPGADPPGDAEAAVVDSFKAAQDFEHGGLSGPVGPNQTDTVLGSNQPVDVFKQELMGITLARGRELDHDLFSSSHCRGSWAKPLLTPTPDC